ncbi:hypothetical protein V8F20_007454 [Naviculisporaceae sp. PSN 640]
MTVTSPFSPSRHPGVIDFQQYVESFKSEHVHDGVDGRGETQRFICLAGLTNYWTSERITTVLGLGYFPSLNELYLPKIKRSHLQVFSILCYIGYPSAILDFIVDGLLSDKDLPLVPSTGIPIHPGVTLAHLNHLFSSFYRAQWKFAPVVFDDGMHRGELSVNQILPIRGQKKLEVRTGWTDTKIYRVTLHECCNRLPVKEVVFKTFNAHLTPRLANLWENEAVSYEKMSRRVRAATSRSTHLEEGRWISSPSEGVLKCFGSFKQRADMDTQHKATRQNYTHFIILEYASGGTLADFVRSHGSFMPSSKWEDHRDFWDGVLYILVGLEHLHGLNITHRDLKLSNILDTGPNLSDRNRSRFRVTDFGTAINLDKPVNSVASTPVTNSNYLAPECVRGSTLASRPPADIWALGCIFSEMFIRFWLGDEGVKEYATRREEEIKSKAPLQGTSSKRGYHDGVRRLACVDDMHRETLKGRPDDSVLHLVSRIILDMMLQPIETRERATAGEIRAAWLKGLERLEKKRRDMARSHLVVVKRSASSSKARRKAISLPLLKVNNLEVFTIPYGSIILSIS